MADEPTLETPSAPDPLVHPDPQGRMRSYAPGHGPGPDGSVIELLDSTQFQTATGQVMNSVTGGPSNG